MSFVGSGENYEKHRQKTGTKKRHGGYVPEAEGQFSVARVVRPRTKSSNACLCFTLMSKMPDQKPWKRPTSTRDHSQGIILDLQENCDWRMPSTVTLHSNNMALSLEDNMQVQCLPVFGSDRLKWTYRKVPKVTEFRNFGRLPALVQKTTEDDLPPLRRRHDEDCHCT